MLVITRVYMQSMSFHIGTSPFEVKNTHLDWVNLDMVDPKKSLSRRIGSRGPWEINEAKKFSSSIIHITLW